MIRQIVLAIIIGALAIPLTMAQQIEKRVEMKHKSERGEMAMHHDGLTKKLNLTEAQEVQMKRLNIEMMKKQTELKSKVQLLRLDIKQLFLADKIDRSALEKNIKSISGLQEQMKLNKVDHWFSVNSLLNPEQQKAWKAQAQNMQENMAPGMKRMIKKRIIEDDSDDK